jgi:cytochrome c553
MNYRNWKLITTSAIIALVFAIFSNVIWAFPDYDGCKDCHGGFKDNDYVSKQDSSPWNESLMDGHETFVGDECDACHKSGGKGEVFLNFSADSSLSKSCVGCHGRQQDVKNSCVGGDGMQVECGGGSGLRRMHELNVGTGTCSSCHSGDPTPVGEDINPFFYGMSGVVVKNACDADGTESRYGTTGLDNDGDGSRDSSDSDCQVSNSPPTQPGALSATAVTTGSAQISWGASTDADNDAITYHVEYRSNGIGTWSDAGSTSTNSRALSGLLDQQSYDVQVTPNDGSEDGPARTSVNLFMTDTISQLSCLDLGALAYDNWTLTDAGGTGQLPSGESSADYVRCKACHGWDRMGTDGGYVRRSRTAGRPNAGAGDSDQSSRNISLAKREGTNITADMILHSNTGRFISEGSASWVDLDATHSAANKAAHSQGYTLGNQHPDFSGTDLTQEQVDCLIDFLNSEEADSAAYFETIYPATKPVSYTIKSSADAAAGEVYYNANCLGCHGDPATDHQGPNGGKPSGGVLAYLQGDGKFSEFAHKARWGVPGTSMTREVMGAPDANDVSDMMLYLQGLGETGFSINPGLSGNWWGGPTRAGEGFLIEVAYNAEGDTIMVVSFYTYDSVGDQTWLIGAGTVTSNIAEISLLIPAGAMWGAAFDPDDRTETPWGTATFSFSSCGTGSIKLEPNTDMQNGGYTILEYPINRDLLVPGIECPTAAKVLIQ